MAPLDLPITVAQAKEPITYEEARALTDRIKESLAFRPPKNPHPRPIERTMQNRLASVLRDEGLTVTTEEQMPVGGRADIVIWDGDQPETIIEVKAFGILRGLAQLFAYSYGWTPRPKLVLACSGATRFDQVACQQAGVEIWCESHRFPEAS